MTSREIDALIAEKVMGLNPSQDADDYWEYLNAEKQWRDVPEFSTDSAASKQLRDKMRADGWGYRIVSHALLEPLSYSCSFIAPTDSSFGKVVWADTEEMAVALAALKATGVEVEAMAQNSAEGR